MCVLLTVPPRHHPMPQRWCCWQPGAAEPVVPSGTAGGCQQHPPGRDALELAPAGAPAGLAPASSQLLELDEARRQEQMFGSAPRERQGSGRPPLVLRAGLALALHSLPSDAPRVVLAGLA